MHNPFAGLRVWDTWRPGHLAVDYGMDVGDAITAPAAGVYRHDGYFRDAGIRGSLVLPDGSRILFCHLSRHVVGDGARVAEGQTIAEAGNTGTSSGSHLHTYGLTPAGARWNWTIPATLAGVEPPRPFPTDPEPDPDPDPEEDMFKIITVSVPVDGGGHQYWSLNIADHSIALLRNGTQLEFRRALGIPEYLNQAPAILEGMNRIA